MRDRQSTALRQLREAIDCLPRATRLAMLEGISRNPIIAGAYADAAGICPMLAAHRAGGRTSFIAFARAWDAFAFRSSRRCAARPATERELLVLRTHLEASLLEDDCPEQDLAAAAAEHRALMARRPAAERAPSDASDHRPRPGDPDRSRELQRRSGWRWMRVVRSLDEYERALEALAQDTRGTAEAGELPAPRSAVSA
ncbi:MAG TPA: hypothetical protein VFP55_15010 [Solirubrobacteraceae bacterium]|nr:hypothetical protein [Solirubrobacteraceae bacterium]